MSVPFETSSHLAAPRMAHGFFGRQGGVSTGLYDSLNAGPGSDDDPAHVAENRARIAAAFGASELISVHQVHSAIAVQVTARFALRPQADAMVTDKPGLALCILSADCTPVLFADIEAGVIGAAHAGWKGALGGVLESTLDAMEKIGAQRARIAAAIGPVIQQESYEVGPEFRDAFLSQDEDAEDLFAGGRGDRFHFDLPGFCARRLWRAGAGTVENLRRDTCAQESLYFSNRRRNLRGEADYGRNASVILLKA